MAKTWCARATTTQLYPSRDTFEFDQGHVTKNQPVTVSVLLSESLDIRKIVRRANTFRNSNKKRVIINYRGLPIFIFVLVM